jgi:RHH-type rel operon transcriptional repressor/antitoxin RelB
MLNGGGAVLGLRLDNSMEQRLARFAKATRRSKSDIARDAMREYLDRHAADDAYVEQVRALATVLDESRLDEIEALTDDVMADEPDYDWGTTQR